MKIAGKRAERQLFLSGWKEIANYLGKGVRTVQRYERELGLPVRRPAGRSTGSVLATKAELDAWVTASPIRESFELTRPAVNDGGMTASIKTGLSEMTKLREQMMALRSELRTSVQLLRHSLDGLQQGLHRDDSQRSRSMTVLEPEQRNSYVFELLDTKAPHKAN